MRTTAGDACVPGWWCSESRMPIQACLPVSESVRECARERKKDSRREVYEFASGAQCHLPLCDTLKQPDECTRSARQVWVVRFNNAGAGYLEARDAKLDDCMMDTMCDEEAKRNGRASNMRR